MRFTLFERLKKFFQNQLFNNVFVNVESELKKLCNN